MEVVDLFSILGNKTRMKIIETLLGGEKCVCKIFPKVGRTQSTTSSHLKKLASAGILDSRKEGKNVFYKIIDYRICDIFQVLNHAQEKVCSKDCCKC